MNVDATMEAINNAITAVINKFSFREVIWFVFFCAAHLAYYKSTTGRLNDRQNEINRLAQENHEYRERFQDMLDKKFNYKQGD